MIQLGGDICSSFDSATSREWLETNGIGGYASGTLSGANTRRYHGLLVAAADPPVGRVVTLSKFEETLIVDGERFELSTNRYTGTVYPHGYRSLSRFELDPFPIWTYEVGKVLLQKTVFMVHGENTTVIQWSASRKSGSGRVGGCRFEIKPLVAFRDHHHLRGSRAGFRSDAVTAKGHISIKPEAALPRVHFDHNAESVDYQGHWYRNFEYPIEEERGFDHCEDLYQPFSLTFDLKEPATIIVSTDPERRSRDASKLRKGEMRRRADLIAGSRIKDKGLWPY